MFLLNELVSQAALLSVHPLLSWIAGAHMCGAWEHVQLWGEEQGIDKLQHLYERPDWITKFCSNCTSFSLEPDPCEFLLYFCSCTAITAIYAVIEEQSHSSCQEHWLLTHGFTSTETQTCFKPWWDWGVRSRQVFRNLPEAIEQFGCQVSHLPGECCHHTEERVSQNDIQNLKSIIESLRNSNDHFYFY